MISGRDENLGSTTRAPAQPSTEGTIVEPFVRRDNPVRVATGESVDFTLKH